MSTPGGVELYQSRLAVPRREVVRCDDGDAAGVVAAVAVAVEVALLLLLLLVPSAGEASC